MKHLHNTYKFEFYSFFVSLQLNAAKIYVKIKGCVENISPSILHGVYVHQDMMGIIVKIVSFKWCVIQEYVLDQIIGYIPLK